MFAPKAESEALREPVVMTYPRPTVPNSTILMVVFPILGTFLPCIMIFLYPWWAIVDASDPDFPFAVITIFYFALSLWGFVYGRVKLGKLKRVGVPLSVLVSGVLVFGWSWIIALIWMTVKLVDFLCGIDLWFHPVLEYKNLILIITHLLSLIFWVSVTPRIKRLYTLTQVSNTYLNIGIIVSVLMLAIFVGILFSAFTV